MNAALRAVWRSKALWAIHVIANAALIAAIYGWLWIPDRSVLDLLLAVLAALGILLITSWLHGATLDYFRASHERGEASVRASFRPSLRRICVFALWLVGLCIAVVLALQLKNHLDPAANWIASALTFRLRRPVKPLAVFRALSTAVDVVAFFLIPLLLLQAWKRKWSRTQVLTYFAVFIVGAYLPYRLIWWVPKFRGLYGQAASMTLRFLFAYLLAVTSWLVLASTLGQLGRAGRGSGVRV